MGFFCKSILHLIEIIIYFYKKGILHMILKIESTHFSIASSMDRVHDRLILSSGFNFISFTRMSETCLESTHLTPLLLVPLWKKGLK